MIALTFVLGSLFGGIVATVALCTLHREYQPALVTARPVVGTNKIT